MSIATYRGVKYDTDRKFNELGLIMKKLKIKGKEKELLMERLRKALEGDGCPV